MSAVCQFLVNDMKKPADAGMEGNEPWLVYVFSILI